MANRRIWWLQGNKNRGIEAFDGDDGTEFKIDDQTVDLSDVPQLRADVDNLIAGGGGGVVIPTTGYYSITPTNNNVLTVNVVATVDQTIDRFAFFWDTNGSPSGNDGTAKSVSAGTQLISTETLADSATADPWNDGASGFLWVRSASGSVWSQLTPSIDGGNGGYLVTANATNPPTQITDFAVSTTGLNDAAQVSYTFSTTTIIDGVTLQYDLCNIVGTDIVTLSADVTSGGTYSSLLPSTASATQTYNLAIVVYPASDPLGVTSSRRSISNIVTHTTGMVGTITVSIDPINDTGGPGTTTVIVTVSDADIDEVYLAVDDATIPGSADGTWEAMSVANGWTESPTGTFTNSTYAGIAEYGPHTLYAIGRDGTYPSAYTAQVSDTMTAVDTGGSNAVIQFVATTAAVKEEGAPTHTITISRSGDVTGTSTVVVSVAPGTDSPAVAGVNFYPVSKTVSFDADASTTTVDVDILWANLGHDYRTIVATLSSPTTDTLGANTTQTITINGTYGYMSYGRAAGKYDIDLNNPPTNLAKLNGTQTLTGTSTEYYEFKEIDGGGVGHGLYGSGVGNKYPENCVIYNVGKDGIHTDNSTEIHPRNCLIHDCGKDPTYVSGGYGDAIQFANSTGSCSSNGNYAYNCTFLTHFYFCSGGSGKTYTANFNYRLQDDYAKSDKGTSIIAWSACTNMYSPQAKGNVLNCGLYPILNAGSDMINTWQSGCNASYGGDISLNYMYGGSKNNSSSTGIILGDWAPNKGYWTSQYNTIIQTGGNAALSSAGGIYNVHQYNDIYWNPNNTGTSAGYNGVALGAGRSQGVFAGQYHHATVQYNRILWYAYRADQGGSLKNLQYYDPSINGTYEKDGLPNHGTPAGTSSTSPAGWSSNYDMSLYWGSGANWLGDDIFINCKAILRQPAYADGCFVLWASKDSTAGNGTLLYDQSAKTLSWREYNDDFGDPVTIYVGSPTPQATLNYSSGIGSDSRYQLYSANGNYIYVCLFDRTTFDALASDTQWTIKVTNHKKKDVFIYPGPSSDWSGFSDSGTSPAADIVPPPVPTSLAEGTSTSSYNEMTWDQMVDADGTTIGYNVYRQDVTALETGLSYYDTVLDSAASASVLTYQDAGITAAHQYNYAVNAYDDSNNVSARCAAISITAVSPTSYAFNNEGTSSDASGMDNNSNSVVITSDGSVVNIANAAAANARATDSWTTGAGKTHIDIEIRYRSVLNGGYYSQPVIAINTTTGGGYSGNVWTGYLPNTSGAWSIVTPSTKTVSAATLYYIDYWVNSNVAGDNFDIDYIRITESA